MTTDNTQELDELLDTYDMSLVCSECEHPYCQRRKGLFRQAILDWHNKHTLELLDKLEEQGRPGVSSDGQKTLVINVSAIEAERERLKS